MAGSDLTGGKPLLRSAKGKPGGGAEGLESLSPNLESLYRLCFDSAPYGVLIHDDTGRILLYNHQLELITGYGCSEIQDLPTWINTIYPDPAYRSLVIQAHQDALFDTSIRTRVAMITRKDGQVWMCRFSSCRPSDGLRIVFVQPDEDSVAAAPPPAESRQHARRLYEKGLLPTLLWIREAADFILISYNVAAQNLLGKLMAPALGRKQNDLFASHPQVFECLRLCLDEKRTLHTEFWWKTDDDGSKKYLRLSFFCAASTLVTVNIEDLTRLRQAEEAIIRKEDRFQQLVDLLPETVCELDAEGRITFLNRYGFERFGITPEDLQRGLSPWDLVLPEDRQRAMENIQRELRGESPVPPNDYTAICKNGRHVPHIVLSQPVVKEGKIAGLTVIIIDITELREMETALRNNEERLRLAVEAAHIGIYATDLETDNRQWSAEMYAIVGQQPGTIKTDKEAWSIVHPEDRARVLETHRRALDPEGNGLFYTEHRIIRPSGEVRWLAWQGRTFFRDTSSGRVPTRRIGACIDITQRKLAEIALQLSENKFSKMFNASPHGLAITTFNEGRYLEANPTESFLTGYTREELIGRTALELGFYDNPEDSQEIRRRLTRNGTVNNYEFRLHRKSGEIRWGLLSANLIEFEGKKCLLSTVSDVTDLHNAEEALKLSEERLRMATEGATVGWWDWDIRSGSIVCNDIYYTMLGFSPQEFPLTLESWEELVCADDRQSVLRTLNQVLDGTLPILMDEYRIKCKDGSWRWIQDIGRVFERDADGRAARAIGIHIDIHDRKVFEEKLFKANQDLEERVKQRTAALEEMNENLRREISRRAAVEDELRAKTEELAEINSALRVILRKSREECEENTTKMAASIRQLALPHLEKLKRERLNGRQAAYVQLLDDALSDVTSPAFASLTELQRKLTASEFQVAGFIHQGKTSKQISEILLLSCRTIESHRKSIRKKLGLQHSKTNLRSHLAFIDKSTIQL